MTFIKYEKIHRFGKDEVDGILNGTCFIQEKIDGANTSIWLEGDVLHMGSRSQEITEGFNGFVDYVKNHEGINLLLENHPQYRLYGEWLVRHTISYNETAYKQFYLFDIMCDGEFIDIDLVNKFADLYDIKRPELFLILENPTEEQVKSFVGQSKIGDKGEGVVIKNFGFVNDFGRCDYAKIVTEKFKENNAIVFGGNNKHSDAYWEMYIVNKYCTVARVQKIMNKIQPTIDEKLDMKHTPRILNTCYNDILTEEIWEIQKKVPIINFGKLKYLCVKKNRQIYHDILNNNLSVADIC